MSGVAAIVRTAWAKEPVVCFSVALGVVGLALPLFVPKLWGQYPDKIRADERNAAMEATRMEALKRSGFA